MSNFEKQRNVEDLEKTIPKRDPCFLEIDKPICGADPDRNDIFDEVTGNEDNNDNFSEHDTMKYANIFLDDFMNFSTLKKCPTKEEFASNTRHTKISIGIIRTFLDELFKKILK